MEIFKLFVKTTYNTNSKITKGASMMQEKFKTFVARTQSLPDYKEPLGFGIARLEFGQKSGATLSATYPLLNWKGENLMPLLQIRN